MCKIYRSLFYGLFLSVILITVCSLSLLLTPVPTKAAATSEQTAITRVTMNRSILRIYNGNMYQLYAKTSPRSTVRWRSSNSLVATVDSYGMVRSRNRGTCRIYATAGGVTVACRVTVL